MTQDTPFESIGTLFIVFKVRRKFNEMNIQKRLQNEKKYNGNQPMPMRTSVQTPPTSFLGMLWRRAGELRSHAVEKFVNIAATRPEARRKTNSYGSSRH